MHEKALAVIPCPLPLAPGGKSTWELDASPVSLVTSRGAAGVPGGTALAGAAVPAVLLAPV